MKQFLEKNPVAAVGLVIAMLTTAGLATYFVTMRQSGPKVAQAFYFDLDSKELF